MQHSPAAMPDSPRQAFAIDRFVRAGLFAAGFLSLAAPRGAYLFAALFTTAVAAAVRREGRNLRFRPAPDMLMWLWVLFAAYVAFSIAWSLAPGAAVPKAFLLASFVTAAYAVAYWCADTPPALPERLSGAIWAGFLAGIVFIAIEILFGQPVKLALFTWFDFLDPESAKHVVFRDGQIRDIPPYVMNRNAAAAALLLWPALLALARSVRGRARTAAAAAIGLLCGVSVFASWHESSKLALVAGAIVFAFAWRWRQGMRNVLTAAWIAAVVLPVPTALLAHKAELHKAEWLFVTARARVIIWHETAVKYLEAPVFGRGVRSTRVLYDTPDPVRLENGRLVGSGVGRHAHNVYLQTWFELGAIGAALLLGLGLLVVRRIGTLAADAQPYALAAFAGAMTVAAFSYGMWQAWYMALFFMAAAWIYIAAAPERPL